MNREEIPRENYINNSANYNGYLDENKLQELDQEVSNYLNSSDYENLNEIDENKINNEEYNNEIENMDNFDSYGAFMYDRENLQKRIAELENLNFTLNEQNQ